MPVPYSLEVYNYHFYLENQREGLLHAKWFMPLLLKTFEFDSLVDVGCGTGHFLKWCFDNGISDYFGIEGSKYAANNPLVPKVVLADLRFPFTHYKHFDLAISIEVAEHLEEEYADTFVNTLCGLSNTVVLTAAVPGQGGHWHMNERPKEYWVEKFLDHNYFYDNLADAKLHDGIAEARVSGEHVAGWFRNIMAFRRAA